jgi:hypothetical protein
MKTKFFYSSLIETSNISLELAEMEMSSDERFHLISLVEANIHSVVVDRVLSELSEEDKKIFLKNMVSEDHEKTWEHLKSKADKIEDKIRKTIEEFKKELLRDIAQAHKLSKKEKPKIKLNP